MASLIHNKTRFLFWGIFSLLFCINTGTVAAQSKIPFSLPARSELAKLRSAILYTNKGKVYFRLYPDKAPWHVANFKYLADKGFYKNLPFHIFKPDFLIQGGAPGHRPNSGPGYTLPAEFNDLTHTFGTLSMVRRPDDLDMNHTRRSHGSQFFVLVRHASTMDGKFTAFGRVIKGMDVVKKLRKGDLIKDVQVFVKEGGLR